MAADVFIQCRVTPLTKAHLRALATEEGVPESVVLRRFLEHLPSPSGATVAVSPAERTRSHRDCRLYVRVSVEDRLLLASRARERGLPPATYASVLLRAHLRALSPLPKAELLALRELMGELGAIGRNLNQLARLANAGQGAPEMTADQAGTVLKLCLGLRNHVKELLLANARSWKRGHETDKE